RDRVSSVRRRNRTGKWAWRGPGGRQPMPADRGLTATGPCARVSAPTRIGRTRRALATLRSIATTRVLPSPAGLVSVLCLVLAAACMIATPSRAAETGQAGRAVQEGCVRREPEPLLVPAPGRPTPVFVRTGDREALETFSIDPGTELAIRHFGCAHFALEFTFVTRAGRPKGRTAWPSRAAQWLRSLPVTSSQRQLVDHIAQRLDQAAVRGDKPGTPLPLSETATLRIEVHPGRSDTRLIILYQVAL